MYVYQKNGTVKRSYMYVHVHVHVVLQILNSKEVYGNFSEGVGNFEFEGSYDDFSEGQLNANKFRSSVC